VPAQRAQGTGPRPAGGPLLGILTLQAAGLPALPVLLISVAIIRWWVGGQDGRYRPVRLLAVGGVGELREADDALLGRRVAVKVLAEELANDRVAVRRFPRGRGPRPSWTTPTPPGCSTSWTARRRC